MATLLAFASDQFHLPFGGLAFGTFVRMILLGIPSVSATFAIMDHDVLGIPACTPARWTFRGCVIDTTYPHMSAYTAGKGAALSCSYRIVDRG